MLIGTLIVNVLCLWGGLVVLRRLGRAVAAADAPQSFARILATSMPLVSPQVGAGPEASAAPATLGSEGLGPVALIALPAGEQERARDERLVRTLSVPGRLATLRRLLSRNAAEEAAARAGLAVEARQAMGCLHGWREKSAC